MGSYRSVVLKIWSTGCIRSGPNFEKGFVAWLLFPLENTIFQAWKRKRGKRNPPNPTRKEIITDQERKKQKKRKMAAIQPQNILNIPTQKFSLGCPVLDRLFDGGIPTGSITELVSESACGKTQLCLQLLLSAAHRSSSSSLFIHTEFPFPFRRLRQLALSFQSPDRPSDDPCDRIFIHAANTADDLLALLDSIDVLLAAPAPQPIRLIVIDSIAALFRSEFDNSPGDLRRRSLLFFKIAGKLKAQAARFGVAVVVTNQVVDLVDEEGTNGLRIGNYEALYSWGRRVCPALGLAWANCVNSRVFLSRTEEFMNGGDESEVGRSVRTRRRMQLVFSPHLPESSCEYVIVRDGVYGVG